MAGEGTHLTTVVIAAKLRTPGSAARLSISFTDRDGRTPARPYRYRPGGRFTDRIDVELPAVALGRIGHGRHGHDRLADDPVRHGVDGSGPHAVAGHGVRVRVRHVDRNDG